MPEVMHSERREDFPGNRRFYPFTVTPTDALYSDWIDLRAPSLATVTFNIKGLTDPEYLDTNARTLVGYHDSDTPLATPDGGAADQTSQVTSTASQFIIDASEYEFRVLFFSARWIYLSVSAVHFLGDPNTHTADVKATLVI